MARILVVDDEPINVKMLSRLLSHEGYEIIEADNGQAALDMTKAEHPDLILLDVMMPGMDGFEVCRRLKSQESTRLIPIVMVTALDTLEDKVHGIEVGADDFLTKPYNRVELLARTKSLIKMKALNEDLALAYAHLTELNDYADKLFASFEPSSFALTDSLLALVDQLLRKSPAEIERPETIFLAVGDAGPIITGRLYRRDGDRLAADPAPVSVPRDSVIGFSDEGLDVAFSNWRDVADSVEDYQEFFEPAIRERISPILNYTAYHSGRVAIMAFNYGKEVGFHHAQGLKGMAAHVNFLQTVADQMREVEEAFLYTVEALARAAEAKDEETGNHILRVKSYTQHLAQELGLDAEYVDQIGYSSMMHDVGKIHIPESILLKEGPLASEEWREMMKHTVYGAQILGDHPRLELARQIALHHHEKWDGSGYPRRLKGEKISLAGRIVTLADIYDALRSQRSYKPAFSHQKTIDIMLNGDGRVEPSHFDPQVHEAFRRIHGDFADIYEDLADEDEPGRPTAGVN